MSSSKVYIYVKADRVIHSVGEVPKGKALYMCKAFKPLLDNGGCPEMSDRDGVLFETPNVDLKAMGTIVRWMKPYQTRGDRAKQALTLKHVGSNDLNKVLYFYKTCSVIGLHYTMRGDPLRDVILEHVANYPISIENFKTIVEASTYDTHVVNALLRATATFKLSTPPADLEKIEDFIAEKQLDRKYFGMVRAIATQPQSTPAGEDAEDAEQEAVSQTPADGTSATQQPAVQEPERVFLPHISYAAKVKEDSERQ